jgi:hypothetical protein
VTGCGLPSSRAERQPVQAAVVEVAETGKDRRAPVCAAIAIGILERDELGRVGHVQPPIAPDQSHGEDQPVGEDVRALEPPVPVLVLEHADPALPRPGAEFGVEVQPR